MCVKRIICLGLIGVGAVMIGYGVYAKARMAAAEHEIHGMSQSKDPIMKSVGSDMESKMGAYGSKTKWLFIGGGVLVLLGASGAYVCRHKHHHHH